VEVDIGGATGFVARDARVVVADDSTAESACFLGAFDREGIVESVLDKWKWKEGKEVEMEKRERVGGQWSGGGRELI
jgi:hypothetical protein